MGHRNDHKKETGKHDTAKVNKQNKIKLMCIAFKITSTGYFRNRSIAYPASDKKTLKMSLSGTVRNIKKKVQKCVI